MLKKVLYALFLIGAFLYTYLSIQPALCFHMQQPPFYRDINFFNHYIGIIGGLGVYFSNYFAQALQSNFWGSAVIVLLATTLAGFLYLSLRKLGLKKGMLLALLPVSMAVSLFHDYYFPLVILLQTVLIALSVLGYAYSIRYNVISPIVALVFYGFLYYIFGSGAALVFGISCILVHFYITSTKELIIKTLVFILALAILPFIAYKLIFNYSLSQAYFHFLPDLPVTLTYMKPTMLYLFVFIVPIVLFLAILNSKIKMREGKAMDFFQKNNFQVGFIIIVLVVFMGIIFFTSNKHLKNIAKVDYLTYNQQWNEAINAAKADDEYNILTNFNYNRAICNNGKFLDLFFDYPQMLGSKSLAADQLGTPMYGIQASDFYYDLNYISRSQHLAYGILVLEPYNLRVLQKLVKTNLILGNFGAAKTFLELLSTNSLSINFCKKYKPYVQDTSKISTDSELSEKRRFMPNNFAIPVQITERFKDLIDFNQNPNQKAYEHLQLSYLLDHNLAGFMNYLDASMKFYNRIPTVYEEALMVYIYSTQMRNDLLPLISKSSKNNFSAFMETLKQNNNDVQAAKSSLSEFRSSFMYYLNYYSPKVTGLEVKTMK